jgi:hypothetical protein
MKRFLLVPLVWLGVTLAAQQPAAVPEIPFDSVPNFLKVPADMNFGEGSGVAVNSKGHVFFFTRANVNGPAFAATAAQLLEFGPDGKLIKEIGRGLRFRLRTMCASTKTTTSGPWTRARIWS